MAIGQNDFHYDKFKTPFYKLEVANAAGKNFIDLPPSLHKLIEKVEIVETLADCHHSAQITITFTEGSREPFRQNPAISTKDLYSDVDVSNSIGLLADLEFVKIGSQTSFTNISANQVGAALVGSVADTLTSLGSAESVEVKELGQANKTPNKPAKYVFEEGNVIKVTWGYREDLQRTRTVAGRIQFVQMQFPEAGHPKLTLTCLGSTSFLDQISPEKGVIFHTQQSAGFDPTSGPIFTFSDKPTKQIIEELCQKAGMKAIVSNNLLSPVSDSQHAKVIPAGKSFHEFLRQLAKSNNAYYIAFIDPKTGQDTIAFISRNDWESKPIIPEDYLFKFRGAGSIIRSINVRADFSGILGNGVYGVDSSGKKIKAKSTTGQVAMVLYEGGGQADASPISGNAIPSAVELNKNIAEGGNHIIGKASVSPEADNPESLLGKSQSAAHCQGKLIYIDFVTLGFALLRPGIVKFDGIGKRYSGHYNIMTVTHTIDINGYVCRGTASGNAIYGASGINVPNAQSGQTNTNVPIQLFQGASLNTITNPSNIGLAAATTASNTNAMDQLNNIMLGTA